MDAKKQDLQPQKRDHTTRRDPERPETGPGGQPVRGSDSGTFGDQFAPKAEAIGPKTECFGLE